MCPRLQSGVGAAFLLDLPAPCRVASPLHVKGIRLSWRHRERFKSRTLRHTEMEGLLLGVRHSSLTFIDAHYCSAALNQRWASASRLTLNNCTRRLLKQNVITSSPITTLRLLVHGSRGHVRLRVVASRRSRLQPRRPTRLWAPKVFGIIKRKLSRCSRMPFAKLFAQIDAHFVSFGLFFFRCLHKSLSHPLSMCFLLGARLIGEPRPCSQFACAVVCSRRCAHK